MDLKTCMLRSNMLPQQSMEALASIASWLFGFSQQNLLCMDFVISMDPMDDFRQASQSVAASDSPKLRNLCNKCIPGIATNGARALGRTTRNKKLLGAPGIATNGARMLRNWPLGH